MKGHLSAYCRKAHLAENLIVLDIDLNFLLRPLKGKIEKRMVRAFQKRFS